MPKPKREKAGSLSKFERQKLQKMYTQCGAAFGSVPNRMKSSNLPVSKVRQFLHSKPSYMKFTLATRNFKRMKAFARFKNEISCMDPAYVDELAKDRNGLIFVLVGHDLFDRTVDAKGMKTKRFQSNGPCSYDPDYNKMNYKSLGKQGNGICWRFYKTMQTMQN